MKTSIILIIVSMILSPLCYAEGPLRREINGNNQHDYGNGYRDGYQDSKDTQILHKGNWYDKLLEQGGVPAPGQPQPIVIEKENNFSRAIKNLEKFQQEQQERQDRDMEVKQKAVKLYKEMVDAGYAPMQAWSITLKDLGFPPPDK